MKWKKLPYWLRGGIIGIGIGILVFLGLYIWSITIPKSIFAGAMISHKQPHILIILLVLPIGIVEFLRELRGIDNSSVLGVVFILFFGLLLYFLIGSFIG